MGIEFISKLFDVLDASQKPRMVIFSFILIIMLLETLGQHVLSFNQ